MSAASNPDSYRTMSRAEFTERHPVTLEQFDLWDEGGRPVVIGLPLICDSLEAYAEFWSLVPHRDDPEDPRLSRHAPR